MPRPRDRRSNRAPKAQLQPKPGATPRETVEQESQALKARFNPLRRAFSAWELVEEFCEPGAMPQARGEGAPLALQASLHFAEFREHLLESRIGPEPVPDRIEAQLIGR